MTLGKCGGAMNGVSSVSDEAWLLESTDGQRMESRSELGKGAQSKSGS